MTEQMKQEIRKFARECRSDYAKSIYKHFAEFVNGKVEYYNQSIRLEGEPEMTFEEMAELLQEKLTTYRGKQ